MHLSNLYTVGAMIFYSILTFFIGPLITRPVLGSNPENCIVGFTLGFFISVFLWVYYGKKLAKN